MKPTNKKVSVRKCDKKKLEEDLNKVFLPYFVQKVRQLAKVHTEQELSIDFKEYLLAICDELDKPEEVKLGKRKHK